MEPNGRTGKDGSQFLIQSSRSSSQSTTREKPPHAKTARILDACRWKDTELLRALATSEGGLISDDVRRQAWPLLLGCPAAETNPKAEDGILEDWRTLPVHREEHQVQLDVARAFIFYPHNQSSQDLDRKKQELSDLITEVLRRQPYLYYFQGYHDICQVFLLVLDESNCAAALARLSTLRIRDFMLPKLDSALAQLSLIPTIICASNVELYNHLSGVRPWFALSGTLTMYAHDIQEYGDIARLFDVLLAREAVFSVYMFAQIVLQRSQELFEIPSDEPDMLQSILSKVPQPLDVETLISNTIKLFEKHPPEKLRTWSRISKSSVLKTARWPHQTAQQTLRDGEMYFKKQVKELQWAERRKHVMTALSTPSNYKKPVGGVAVAVLIGVLSMWVRRSSLLSGPFGALDRFWKWYVGYPGH